MSAFSSLTRSGLVLLQQRLEEGMQPLKHLVPTFLATQLAIGIHHQGALCAVATRGAGGRCRFAADLIHEVVQNLSAMLHYQLGVVF